MNKYESRSNREIDVRLLACSPSAGPSLEESRQWRYDCEKFQNPKALPPREAFPIVRRLCAESNVVGFELVELAPMLDPTHVSAMNANRLIRECMTGIAMRKKGLTDEHYLSPLSIDDNRNWGLTCSRCPGYSVRSAELEFSNRSCAVGKMIVQRC